MRRPRDQVDFTSGPKPASVVAAVVTLCSNVSNQYVCTNPTVRDAAEWGSRGFSTCHSQIPTSIHSNSLEFW